MRKDLKNRVGETYITNEGYNVEIVDYFTSKNCTIQFDDGVKYYNIEYNALKKGRVKNLFHPSVYNKGYFGIGSYKSKVGNKQTKAYNTWNKMLTRCYSDKYLLKKPTYKDCTVAEEWHNFQVFAKWFEENYNPDYMQDWHLDKDLLIDCNKKYSSETCCLIPNYINSIFTNQIHRKEHCTFSKKRNKYISRVCTDKGRISIGAFNTVQEASQAYKIVKEKHIKEVADKWKDLVSEQVYQALMNYKITID